MQEEWWENPTRIVNDYWWIFLILLFLLLSGWFTRDYWMPAPPPPTSTATSVPTPSPLPSFTPRPLPTPTLGPTATRVATLGTGDVQVTLLWDSVNDLDLMVTDPAGKTIYFNHDRSASNGQLDVDANPRCNNLTTTPVENIFWPTGGAPRGTYQVAILYYEVCQPEARTPFTIRLLINGETQTFEDVASTEKEVIEITTFAME